MQIFPCPFCGPRNETEFHFAGELGKVRPDTGKEVNARDWATYLYAQRNEKGLVREVWLHLTCSELFVMERDSLTMDVRASKSLRGDAL
ncbi:sarcosine oxidase subunit delta [Litoreibacter ascidiaceicola]|uniref:Sarcosine oxidase subunit delta n=1 Tax=Litoreibacter ascidiaceicola TaxID=1486859 RepID=A0A1M5ELP3_9RHOB|nr:sarcosine oxidase subunit delta [Litoreibacter ascidiaceicola]SHF80001.1 sarcosine oxidase subunit delta [Litoreibacter ascidiaceicola]